MSVNDVPDVVLANDMRRHWWIYWCWIDITEWGSRERTYLKGAQRPIEEAQEAAAQFEAWLPVAKHLSERITE